jgi:hypothetical protein
MNKRERERGPYPLLLHPGSTLAKRKKKKHNQKDQAATTNAQPKPKDRRKKTALDDVRNGVFGIYAQ